MTLQRTVVCTDRAPAAVGPYSQAVHIGTLVFTAGQLPLDPVTGKLVEGGIETQTRRALQNLQAVLEAARSSVANVVKTTVFLLDMGDFGAMNGIYAQFFSANPPARSAVQAAALPKGALVEIEAIACLE